MSIVFVSIEGYSVFIATGAVPEQGDYSSMDVINGSGQWYSVNELLQVRMGELRISTTVSA